MYLLTDMGVVSTLVCLRRHLTHFIYLAREEPRRPHEGGHKEPKRHSHRTRGTVNRVGNSDCLFLPPVPRFLPSLSSFSPVTMSSPKLVQYIRTGIEQGPPLILHPHTYSPPPPPPPPPPQLFIDMPLIRKKPAGHTVRHFKILSSLMSLTTKKSTGTLEAYHYQPLRHHKKIVQLNTLVPDNESLSNPCYIKVEEHFNIPRRSVKVHDCRVMVDGDMYLVSGFWDRYSDVNRSVKTATGLTWKGELMIVKAGRCVPYLKRVKHPFKADIAAIK